MESQEFIIRQASTDDIPMLVRHRCEMFRDMNQLQTVAYEALVEASTQYFAEAIPSGEYVAWVVAPRSEPERIIAGGGLQLRRILPGTDHTGALRKPGPEGIIVNVYTEKEWRRTGLAELIMRTIIQWSRDNGLSSLALHASPMGRALYERLGFIEGNEMYFPLSGQ